MTLRFSPIIFDFDGTLVDSASTIIASLQEAFKSHNLLEPTTDKITFLIGIPLKEVITQLLVQDEDTKIVNDIIKTYRKVYREYSKTLIKPFPGIIELLTELKTHNAPIGIATSKMTSVALENIDTSGLSPFIDYVVGSDMVKNHKPHPETLEAVISKLPAHPNLKPIIIGDTTYDIEMGTNFSITSCAVTWGAHCIKTLQSSNPAYIADSVSNLRSLLIPNKLT